MAKSAREVAHRVLDRVYRKGAFASLALSAELDRAGLEPRDAALATELVYGVLSNELRIDRSLEAVSDRGLGGLDGWTRLVLRTAAYQLLFLRTPPYAATSEAVSALRKLRGPKMAGLGNALLRRLAERGEAELPHHPTERLLVEHSVPRWIFDAFTKCVGHDDAVGLISSLQKPAGTGMRISPRNFDEAGRERLFADVRSELATKERASAEMAFVPSTWVPSAVVAHRAGPLHKTRAYLEGRFSLQDPAAQYAAYLLDPQPGERILDACAGIGGKSTHMAERMGDRGHIDSLDISPRKLELAMEQARRLGLSSIHPHEQDLLAPWPQPKDLYDRILLDAPCSGLGVLRRHPELKRRSKPNDIARLAETQLQMLRTVAQYLEVGGVLVYTVCTLTAEEAQGVVGRFLAAHATFAQTASRHVLWHKDDADGFFLARLERLETGPGSC